MCPFCRKRVYLFPALTKLLKITGVGREKAFGSQPAGSCRKQLKHFRVRLEKAGFETEALDGYLFAVEGKTLLRL